MLRPLRDDRVPRCIRTSALGSLLRDMEVAAGASFATRRHTGLPSYWSHARLDGPRLGIEPRGCGLEPRPPAAAWYLHIPAAVPDTGPLNPHFVRDVGAAFVTIGAVLLLAAPSRGVLLAVTLFYVLHAAVHVTDLAAGRLDASHWLIDLPGVFLPALVLGALCLPRWWKEAR